MIFTRSDRLAEDPPKDPEVFPIGLTGPLSVSSEPDEKPGEVVLGGLLRTSLMVSGLMALRGIITTALAANISSPCTCVCVSVCVCVCVCVCGDSVGV